MNSSNSGENRESARSKAYNTLTYLALGSITVLFLGLSAAYLLSRGDWTWSEFGFPKLFLLSTLLLVASSYFFHRAKNALISDLPISFRNSAIIGLFLGFSFLISQFGGWFDLQAQGIHLAGKPDGSFLYIISAVHAVHIIVGIFILALMIVKILAEFNNPVKRLMLVTSDLRIKNFGLAVLYWHFVDLLWIYLLFFLLFNHL